jgi:hypothetical protein
VRREVVVVPKLKGFFFRRAAKYFCRPSRNQLKTVFVVVSVLLWIACNRSTNPTASPTVAFETTSQPARVGFVTVEFTLADAATKPVVGAHLTAEADMTHAGMSPVFGTAEEKQPGRYESKLKLEMAGDWVILLHGTLPTGEKLERQFELRNVQPN